MTEAAAAGFKAVRRAGLAAALLLLVLVVVVAGGPGDRALHGFR